MTRASSSTGTRPEIGPLPVQRMGLPHSGRSRAAALTSAAVSAALLACVGLALLMLIPALLGFERYAITGGSMTGTYDRGSIVYSELVPVEALRVGDVITYTPPPGAGPEGLVTHRIDERRRLGDGRLIFRTRGDANAAPDPWTFTLDGPAQSRAVHHLPLAGYAFAVLAIREVRMLVVGLPAALIALLLLARMWSEAGCAARDERSAGAAEA